MIKGAGFDLANEVSEVPVVNGRVVDHVVVPTIWRGDQLRVWNQVSHGLGRGQRHRFVFPEGQQGWHLDVLQLVAEVPVL